MSKDFKFNKGPLFDGGSPRDFALSTHEFGIYLKETTQRFVYGTRYITWDGRVYKYMGITTEGVQPYSGCANTLPAQTDWVTAVAASLGDRSMVVTDNSTIAEDQLAGGMVQTYNATIANSPQYAIVGNDKSNGTNVRIYVEFPLYQAITANDSIEMFANPYRLVDGQLVSHPYNAWVGVACVTAVDGENVWVQSWGPCITSPGNTSLDDAAENVRTAYFKADGSISEVDGAGVTASENQMAGYILNQGTLGIAGPQIYLMCST